MFRDTKQRKSIGNVFYTLAHLPSWKDSADQRVAMALALDIVRGTSELGLMDAITRATRAFKKDWLQGFVVAMAADDYDSFDAYADHFLPKAVQMLEQERIAEQRAIEATHQHHAPPPNSMPPQVPM